MSEGGGRYGERPTPVEGGYTDTDGGYTDGGYTDGGYTDGGYTDGGYRPDPNHDGGTGVRRPPRYDFYDDPSHQHEVAYEGEGYVVESRTPGGERPGGGYEDEAHHDDGFHDDGFHGDGFHDDGWHDDGFHDDGWHEEEDGWPVVDGPPSATGDHRGGGHRRGRRRSRHPILEGLAILVVLVLVVVGGGLLWAQSQINPGGHRGPAVTVAIPKGSTTTQIGDKLASAGIIHNGSLFALYVHLHGYTLLPGTYSLAKNSPYSSAISALRSGPTVLTEKLVIPEGYTLDQIAAAVARLPHMGLSAQKFLAAAKSTERSPYEPPSVNNLEGLLFPATYDVRQGETEVDVLDQMVGAFNERAASLDLTDAAKKLGLTPYQVVIVASIVEREAKRPQDRADVASAIYNRLRIGMKLGADSTQAYWLRLTDPNVVPTAAQDDQPSPYNTRLDPGLPPTPIANPGLASLQVAANPPSTTYLYWVEINPDGQLGFASGSAGFEQLQAQCRAAGLC